MSLELDPDKGGFVFACGAKGRGKSELCKSYFKAYPYYRVLIDANSDVDPNDAFTRPWAPQFELLEERTARNPPRYRCELPEPEGHWPSLRYEVDFLNPDAAYLVDAIVGAVYELTGDNAPEWNGGKAPGCVWVDEVGEFAPAGQVTPWMRQGLHNGRHRRIALIMAGPRPKTLDVLILAQADVVCIFDTPHELDRARLSAELGIPLSELAALLDNLDEFGYLAWDSWDRELSIMPPLEIGASR